MEPHKPAKNRFSSLPETVFSTSASGLERRKWHKSIGRRVIGFLSSGQERPLSLFLSRDDGTVSRQSARNSRMNLIHTHSHGDDRALGKKASLPARNWNCKAGSGGTATNKRKHLILKQTHENKLMEIKAMHKAQRNRPFGWAAGR